MAKTTTPTRFDTDMFASAKVAGERTHRSAAQQLAHWARLGQELEAAAGLSTRDVDRVLSGQLSYDEVGDREQAAVRAAWREHVDAQAPRVDLRAKFAAEGRTRYSTADADGQVSVHTLEAPDATPPATAGDKSRRATPR